MLVVKDSDFMFESAFTQFFITLKGRKENVYVYFLWKIMILCCHSIFSLPPVSMDGPLDFPNIHFIDESDPEDDDDNNDVVITNTSNILVRKSKIKYSKFEIQLSLCTTETLGTQKKQPLFKSRCFLEVSLSLKITINIAKLGIMLNFVDRWPLFNYLN